MRLPLHKLILAVIVLLLSPQAFAENEKCVLPAPDYRSPNTSKPSLHGVISNIKVDALEIEISSKTDQNKIRINKQTIIFTSFGGYVAPTELIIGDRINVWYIGCDSKKAGSPPLAAVIEVIR